MSARSIMAQRDSDEYTKMRVVLALRISDGREWVLRISFVPAPMQSILIPSHSHFRFICRAEIDKEG